VITELDPIECKECLNCDLSIAVITALWFIIMGIFGGFTGSSPPKWIFPTVKSPKL